MKTQSKLNLPLLQEKFDLILDSLDKESVTNWLEKDREKQGALLLSGKSIILSSINLSGACQVNNSQVETYQEHHIFAA